MHSDIFYCVLFLLFIKMLTKSWPTVWKHTGLGGQEEAGELAGPATRIRRAQKCVWSIHCPVGLLQSTTSRTSRASSIGSTASTHDPPPTKSYFNLLHQQPLNNRRLLVLWAQAWRGGWAVNIRALLHQHSYHNARSQASSLRVSK